MTQRIVFLDRASLKATVRRPLCAAELVEYPKTALEEIVPRLENATIAITNKVPLRAAEIAQLPDLKLVAVAATGTENVDLAACRERGIAVCNIRDYSLVSVPEHCFALMLAVRRNLLAYAADVAAGRWEQSTRFCLLDHPIGDLAGSRLGIVGYGALGRRVAQIESRMAISPARPAERASSRLAMFAQAIRMTKTVTPRSSVSPLRASRATDVCPRAPFSTVIALARNFCMVWSLMPICSGASTSFMTALYGTLMAVRACSSDTPGLSRANR